MQFSTDFHRRLIDSTICSVLFFLGLWTQAHVAWGSGPELATGLLPGSAATGSNIQLTPEEQTWIKAHPKIVFALDQNWEPLIIRNSDGSQSGMDSDTVALLNTLLGTHIVLETGKWPELVAKLEKRQIDGLSSSAVHAERRAFANFTDAYTSFQKVIYVKKDNPTRIFSHEDLAGKRIAYQEGNLYEEKSVDAYPGVIAIPKAGHKEQFEALLAGEVDGFIGDFAVEYQLVKESIPYFKPVLLLEGTINLVFSVRKDWPELVTIINKGLQQISQQERQRIKERYVQDVEKRITTGTTITLTDAEQTWLAEHHTVRARVSYWPPYMFKEPVPSGMSVDYLNAVGKRFGFKVEFVPDTIGWPAAIQDVMGARQHIDLLLTMNRTPEREQQFAMTADYLSMPWVIYTRKDSPFISGLENLRGKTVAEEKGYVITDMLRSGYPTIHILDVERSEDALQAVATGQADAYVGNLANASFLIKQHGLANLVVAAPTPFGNHTQAMAVRADWPALASMIDKGLATMPMEERNAIGQKWLAVEARPQIDYTLVWQITAGATLIFIAFFYWNRRLAREITHRRRAEEQLRHNEEKLRNLYELSPLGIALTDMQGHYREFNEAFAKICGYPAADLQVLDYWTLTPSEYAEQESAQLASLSRTGRYGPYEKQYQRKDGSRIPIRLNGVLIMGQDGEQLIWSIVEDITAQKQYEAELYQAKESAESANQAKSTFLANMSHELRTPLNAIIGFTSLALHNIDDTKLRDWLDNIEQASQRLLALINDILDLAKIEAGRLTINDNPFILGTVLENLQSLMGQKVREKGLKLHIDLPDNLSGQTFKGDTLRLGQILLNLVSNAVKFTSAGSIIVSARIITSRPDEVLMRWEVKDTGIGIAPEFQTRAFSAFEQADNSSTRAYGGTGLGLAISKHLARMMGGDIGLVSVLGQGSTFWFTVRLGKTSEAPAATDAGSSGERIKARHAGARILLADDEPLNRKFSRILLEKIDLQVDQATDGAEALELARQHRYALILMDVQMPVLNGIDATRAIRENSLNTSTPIIAMTANAFEEDRQKCLSAGMNDHISKPIILQRLFAALLQWMDK